MQNNNMHQFQAYPNPMINNMVRPGMQQPMQNGQMPFNMNMQFRQPAPGQVNMQQMQQTAQRIVAEQANRNALAQQQQQALAVMAAQRLQMGQIGQQMQMGNQQIQPNQQQIMQLAQQVIMQQRQQQGIPLSQQNLEETSRQAARSVLQAKLQQQQAQQQQQQQQTMPLTLQPGQRMTIQPANTQQNMQHNLAMINTPFQNQTYQQFIPQQQQQQQQSQPVPIQNSPQVSLAATPQTNPAASPHPSAGSFQQSVTLSQPQPAQSPAIQPIRMTQPSPAVVYNTQGQQYQPPRPASTKRAKNILIFKKADGTDVKINSVKSDQSSTTPSVPSTPTTKKVTPLVIKNPETGATQRISRTGSVSSSGRPASVSVSEEKPKEVEVEEKVEKEVIKEVEEPKTVEKVEDQEVKDQEVPEKEEKIELVEVKPSAARGLVESLEQNTEEKVVVEDQVVPEKKEEQVKEEVVEEPKKIEEPVKKPFMDLTPSYIKKKAPSPALTKKVAKKDESPTPTHSRQQSTPTTVSETSKAENPPTPTISTPAVSTPESTTPKPAFNKGDSADRKVYDRTMLLNFQSMAQCQNTPPDWDTNKIPFPIMNASLNEDVRSVIKTMRDSSHREISINPNLNIKAKNPRQSGNQGRRPSQNPNFNNKPVIKLPSRPEVKLHKAESALKFGEKSKKEKSAADEVRGLLNKLAPENFETIKLKFIKIDILSDLKSVISLIFNKAIDETHYASTYASLCLYLTTHFKKNNPNKDDKDKDFRVQLIHQCQNAFESANLSMGKEEINAYFMENDKLLKEFAAKKAEYEEKLKDAKAIDKKTIEKEVLRWEDETNERLKKLNKRRFGNVKFIGELYVLGLLVDTVIHNYAIQPLLKTMTNDSVECLFELLICVGPKIDPPQQRGRGQQQKGQGTQLIKSYMQRIKKVHEDEKSELSSKAKFRLQDLLEIQQKGWEKRANMATGPKTIQEVHQDLKKKEEAEARMFAENAKIQNNYGDRRSSLAPHVNKFQGNRNMPGSLDNRQRGNMDSDDFQMAGVSRKKGGFDANRWSKITNQAKEGQGKGISLGRKGGLGRGGKGSSLGKDDSVGRSTPSHMNSRFSMLNNEEPKINGDDKPSNTMDSIKDLLSRPTKEAQVTEEEAIKRSGRVFEDLFSGATDVDTSVKDWYHTENIPLKYLPKILPKKFDDIVINRTAKEQSIFGQFLTKLIAEHPEGPKKMAETDNNIIESLQEQIQSWMECESWSDCPNLWENVANIMYHMFNQKNIKTPFGTKDFKKLVDLCYLKDEYGEYNYKGVFASHMLRLFLESDIFKNEFELTDFWSKTDLKWLELSNSDSESEFQKALQKCSLTFLYLREKNYDEISEYMEKINKKIPLYNISRRGSTDDDRVSLLTNKKFCKDDPDAVIAVFGVLANTIIRMFLDGKIEKQEFTDYAEMVLAPIMETYEHTEHMNTRLETELLYQTEVNFCYLSKQKSSTEQMKELMSGLWDAFCFSKETILDIWGKEPAKFRGASDQERETMKIQCSGFIIFVQNEKDEDY